MFTKEVIELASDCYEAVKKIAKVAGKEWECAIEKGNWVIHKKELCLVVEVWCPVLNRWRMRLNPPDGHEFGYVDIEKVIPILRWEKLEEILGGLGYSSQIQTKMWDQNTFEVFIYYVDKFGSNCQVITEGKKRQETFMQAIIELAEKLEEVK